MERGDVWWATLPPPVDSGPGGRRPVVVVQSDEFTESRIRTVVVVVITSNLRLAQAPGNVFLPADLSGLEKDSVVNLSQLYTVAKFRLTDRVATLPDSLMDEIDAGLRLVLDLF
jgi:mRNA interferase MazF